MRLHAYTYSLRFPPGGVASSPAERSSPSSSDATGGRCARSRSARCAAEDGPGPGSAASSASSARNAAIPAGVRVNAGVSGNASSAGADGFAGRATEVVVGRRERPGALGTGAVRAAGPAPEADATAPASECGINGSVRSRLSVIALRSVSALDCRRSAFARSGWSCTLVSRRIWRDVGTGAHGGVVVGEAVCPDEVEVVLELTLGAVVLALDAPEHRPEVHRVLNDYVHVSATHNTDKGCAHTVVVVRRLRFGHSIQKRFRIVVVLRVRVSTRMGGSAKRRDVRA
jgi:hypothetical protein